MSHLNPGLISAYNSLTDKHLAGYFSNIRIRRHLQRAGLITRSGRIVPDKEYRHKQIQRSHQKHVRECLAHAIFHQVLEMERVHQTEIRRRLEEFARRERVNKLKVECSKRYEEDITRITSPHPPMGARGGRKHHSGPEEEHSESSESHSSSRPNTAPEKLQRPVRLKPIHSNSTTATLRHSSPYRPQESSNESEQLFNSTMETHRRLIRLEAPHGVSPYCLPVINNFVTPVPPATKRKESGTKVTPGGTLRGRRFRPATSFGGADVNEDPPMLRSSLHQSRVSVNMMYFGKAMHLSHDLTDRRDEVKVFQQHCGGENLCVYKGLLHKGETFRFISRRHRGFPFSLTFYLNGLQVERVSSCCEFKHRKGSRLAGRHRHFGFSGVEGASPCYKCIIAMGLDKKPTPPPKRVKEDGGREKPVFRPKDAPAMKTKKRRENSECEPGRSQAKEESAAEEDKVRDDYEEDFEADNEGPPEDAEVREKKSPSPSCESESPAKERDASESEDNEKDEDIKSSSASSFSSSDQDDTDAEADRDPGEDEKADTPEEVDQEVFKPDEVDEPNPEAAAPTEAESAAVEDSDTQNSAGDSTEIDVSDASVPSGSKSKLNDSTSEDREVDKMVNKSKQEEEQERAKSVQEKLAEAILKESQRSSEPELSDTSTEEEELACKGPQMDKDAAPEKLVISAEQQQILTDEESDPKELNDESKQELHQNSVSTKDERVKEDKEDEKSESVEHTAVNNETENTEDAGLHPVNEEEMYDKTSELHGDKEKTANDANDNEQGEEITGREEHESSASEPSKKTDERAVLTNAEVEATTASQTMEMKAETSEERLFLTSEEAPVTTTDKRQQGGGEAASETEVTAEGSSSSLEGSGETTVEKGAETNEDKVQDESNKDSVEAKEVSAGEARKENQERCDLGEEQTEKSLKTDDKIEDESETEGKEDEKQRTPDEQAEDDDGEEHKVNDNENKSHSSHEGKSNQQAEKPFNEEDKRAPEEGADGSEETENDKDSTCVKNENNKEEFEENGADKSDEGGTIGETNNEEKDAEVENNLNERDAEPSEATLNKYEECDATKVAPDETVPGDKMFKTAEEPEKRTGAILNEDNMKTCDENIKSEDVGDSEAANVATMEAEDVKKERGSEKSENGEIDAENGEISSRTENKTQDEGEAPTEIKNHVKTPEQAENKEKTEISLKSDNKEVKEASVCSGAEEHEGEEEDQAPNTDVAGREAEEGGDKKDESTKYNSESETSGTEIKEESKSDDGKDHEETKQDENGNTSYHENENRDSELIENSNDIQSDVTGVKVASVGDQDQSSILKGTDLDGSTPKLDDSTKPSKSDGHPPTNGADVDLPSAASREKEYTEALSKASEEGEGRSVLLQPQTEPSPVTQTSKAELTAERDAGSEDTPEALGREDSIDMVNNWVTMHQASKYFETFVEPLEDLRESGAQESNPTESTKLSRLESPLEMMKASGNAHQEQDINEPVDRSKDGAATSNHSEDGPSSLVKDTLQVVEETAVKEIIPDAESEQNDKSVKGQDLRSEEQKGSRGSLEEDQVKEGSMQEHPEQSEVTTEEESSAGAHHSRGRLEIQSEEEAVGYNPDLNRKQTAAGMNDEPPPSETEECHEPSASPEGLSEWDREEQRRAKGTWGTGRGATEATDFKEDGSREDSHRTETRLQSSDVSINRDGGEVRLIRDIQDTLTVKIN